MEPTTTTNINDRSVLDPGIDENDRISIKYRLYLSQPVDDNLIESFKQHVKSLLPPGEQFELVLKTTTSRKNLCYGHIRFDQNFELEWLVIYCLIELSKFCADLVIKVNDKDGDVLLIEAAEHLPRWLESKMSKNRVYIHQGKVHIIPRDINLKELHQTISDNSAVCSIAESAAKFIRDNNRRDHGSSQPQPVAAFVPKKRLTLADPKIQDSIREKLTGMPDKNLWLKEKYKQLDRIISGDNDFETNENLERSFINSLNLNNIMEMDEADLQISPINSLSSSSPPRSQRLSISTESNCTGPTAGIDSDPQDSCSSSDSLWSNKS